MTIWIHPKSQKKLINQFLGSPDLSHFDPFLTKFEVIQISASKKRDVTFHLWYNGPSTLIKLKSAIWWVGSLEGEIWKKICFILILFDSFSIIKFFLKKGLCHFPSLTMIWLHTKIPTKIPFMGKLLWNKDQTDGQVGGYYSIFHSHQQK